MAYSVKCSMCRGKCTCENTGAFAGAGALCSVHCAMCSVQPATYEYLAVETGQVK